MPAVFVRQFLGQLASVGEVSVVDQDDAVGRVHIERLRFLLFLGISSRRVADVPEADRSYKRAHVAGAVALANLTFGLVDVQRVLIGCCDTGGVLTTVLQEGQCVVHLLIHG